MVESLVIFSIAAVGSLVRWSADVALKHFATKEARETIQIPSRGAWGCPPMGAVDPVVRVGFILACYGAIVLVLVSALPGAFALQRTGFAFALLCAGGVIGEISGAGVTAQNPPPGDAQQEAARPRKASRPLSMALALTLNVSVALLTAGQGLIPSSRCRRRRITPTNWSPSSSSPGAAMTRWTNRPDLIGGGCSEVWVLPSPGVVVR
jgi:hypothetical protein